MTITAAALSLGCSSAGAAPLFGADDLQGNGAVSRHIWRPDFAATEVAGVRVSAALALGLRGVVHTNLDRNVTPALTFSAGMRSSVSVLAAGNRGAMLVLQTAP